MGVRRLPPHEVVLPDHIASNQKCGLHRMRRITK